jgi:hypothetical protein
MHPRLSRPTLAAALAMLAMPVLFAGGVVQSATPATPAQAAESLIAADREFSARAATQSLVDGLTAMFRADVVVPGPPANLYRGLDAVRAYLRASPDADAHAAWTPIRAGVSADGRHGFTFGFMTVTRADGTTTPLKYMAYWTREDGAWRVAGYKRARRPDGEAALTVMAPLLPSRLVAPTADAAVREQQRASLVAAERAFSDRAQRIGLGPAFREFGAPTAVNMGGAASVPYVVGHEAIASLIGGNSPQPTSPVEWSTDVAIVASSGDLGISFGFIRPNEKAADGTTRPGSPFFTIWHRAAPDSPWRYIAE